MFRSTIAGLAVAAFLAPAAAGAQSTGTTSDPGLQIAPKAPTLTSNPLVGEGFKRTVEVSHTCRFAYCDLRVFTRPGTATLHDDYRFLYKRYGFKYGQRLTARVPVVAERDGKAEPRETMKLVAELTVYDAQNQSQVVEGTKTLYILDQP